MTNAYYMYRYDKKHLMEEDEMLEYLKFADIVAYDLISNGNKAIVSDNINNLNLPQSFQVSYLIFIYYVK